MGSPEPEEDPKEKALRAAFAVLQRSGLPHLSYSEIAAETGLSRQLVRYHFPDPESLMLALCDRLADGYRTALLQNAAAVEGGSRIALFLDFYFDTIDGVRKPADDAVYGAMMSLSARSDRIRGTLRSQYTLLGQVLSHEFELAYPELGKRAAEELSYLFVCLMYGHWKMVASLGVSRSHNRISRAAMDRLIRSYLAAAAPAGDMERVWVVED